MPPLNETLLEMNAAIDGEQKNEQNRDWIEANVIPVHEELLELAESATQHPGINRWHRDDYSSCRATLWFVHPAYSTNDRKTAFRVASITSACGPERAWVSVKMLQQQQPQEEGERPAPIIKEGLWVDIGRVVTFEHEGTSIEGHGATYDASKDEYLVGITSRPPAIPLEGLQEIRDIVQFVRNAGSALQRHEIPETLR